MAQTPLDRALQLIKAGRAPIPIPYKSKAPVIAQWQALRITAETASQYFNGQEQNIGVLLGEPSGWLVDVDIDCDEAHAAAPYLLPETACFGRESTPRSHWLFTASACKAKKYTAGNETLIEIRSTGQQTVWPPSVHPSGQVITAANRKQPVIIAAEELHRLVARVAAAAVIGKHWVGARHDLTLRLAGALLHSGWSDQDVQAFLAACAAAGEDEEPQDRQRATIETIARYRRNEATTGWPAVAEILPAEVISKVRQWLAITDMPNLKIGGRPIGDPPPADQWPEAQPLRREPPPAAPFPVDCLGDVLQPMAELLVATIQCPAALAGQAVLAASALTAQQHADVVIDGRIRPTSDFFVTVGGTGERKSAVDTEACAPHYHRQREALEQHRIALAGYEADLGAWKAARSAALGSKDESMAARANAALELGAEPQRPPAPRMLTSEPTYQGLVKALQNDWPSQGLFSDEGGRFLGGYAMSSDNQLATAAGLSNLWDGKPVDRTRSGDGNVTLYGRRLSMHLMIQPPIAAALFGSELLQGQGLLSRCLVSWPESTIGSRPYREADLRGHPAFKQYFARQSALLEAPLPLRPGHLDELEPRQLVLAEPVAKRLWVHFHNHVEQQLGDGKELAGVRGFGAKAAEHALRLAGVLATIGDCRTLEHRHIEAGILLTEYYLAEALRLFQMAGEDPDLRVAEQLLRWLCSRSSECSSTFSLRHVYTYGPNSIRSKDRAEKILGILHAHGWVRPVAHAIEIDGALCRTAWEVRPQ
jgi:hypothetical protein